jgi:protein TonB
LNDQEMNEVNETVGRAVADHPRIVDLVFEPEAGGKTRRLLAGLGTVTALYAIVIGFIGGLGQSAGPWSAEMAARIHDAIAVERSVEVTPPPPPPPSLPTEAPAAPLAAAPRARRPAPSRARPAAPAQAGALAAVSSDPVDLTGTAFVVGSSAQYAGGTTMAAGTSTKPVTGAVAPGGTGDGSASAKHSLARPVSLDQEAWSCPWPAEADAEQVDQQTVVIRVVVRADGRAERVEVVTDPGLGFGRAARACALGTRFQPARDSAGESIAAASPPIRVHFFR